MLMAYLVQSPRICVSICHIVVYLVQSPRIMPLYVLLVGGACVSYVSAVNVMCTDHVRDRCRHILRFWSYW